MANTMTMLDADQVTKSVFDEANAALKVNVVASSGGSSSNTIVSGDGSGNEATVTAGKALLVDGSATTQPVSAASLPLPTGASTSAAQTDGSQKTQIVDGSGNVIGSTGNALDVNVASGITLEVHLDNTNDNVLIYGYDGAVNQPIKTDAAGELQIDVLSSALPTGAATEAKQDAGNASLASIDSNVVIADTDNVTVVSSALPTGASTSANQTNKAQYTRLTDGTDDVTVTAAGELNVLASAQPGVDIGDVTINNAAGGAAVNIQDGGNSITVDGTVAVSSVGGTVTVAATDLDIRDLTSISDSVSAVQSGTWTVNSQEAGYATSAFVRNDYTSVNVTTSAYIELIASTAATYQEFEIFDSSGQTLKIAFGAAASEVDQFLIFPGGNGRIKKQVASGTRISIRAVSATASVGEVDINLYG